MEEQPGLFEQAGLFQVQAQVAVGLLGLLKELNGGCAVTAMQQRAALALWQQLLVLDDIVQACILQANAEQVAVA